MQSQNKAIEPILTRNVNGTKKFSFKMYKRYIDRETGEDTINPFVGYLVNERKVKLYYEDRWYDFIVKNINESSTNYLYTFELEDAIVQELSKNGFGVTLDEKLNNNSADIQTLGEKILSETDWNVEAEILVEKI
jgi:hypothetical protein